MLANLQQLGYLSMTPIQAAALPPALDGRDLIAQAKTGSGKTVAFALPLLNRLDPQRLDVQALVLCPTRELADQVTQEIRRLARFADNIKVLSLCGGTPMRPQRESLAHGAHIAVGTPGRIMDHLERGSLKLEALSTLVLDEADRMLDMGFHDDIAWIASHCPVRRQTLLFSATFPAGIAALAQRYQREPLQVKLAEQHAPDKIRQYFFEIEHAARLQAVATLLRHYRPASTLAFCNTRQQCRALVELLRGEGFHALALHGEMDQRERDQVLIQFANRSCSVLVATDVAARGLDIAQLEAVINVDVTPDPEVHVHRIGRTGRGDEAGLALNLCSNADRRRVATIAEAMGFTPEWQALDDLEIQDSSPLQPPMATLLILGGRKDKIRPGDVLGALSGEAGLTREQVGKITVTDQNTYAAVAREIAGDAARRLAAGKLKGRTVKVRVLEG
jgi:ATP-independent RNA helicase DbpA